MREDDPELDTGVKDVQMRVLGRKLSRLGDQRCALKHTEELDG